MKPTVARSSNPTLKGLNYVDQRSGGFCSTLSGSGLLDDPFPGWRGVPHHPGLFMLVPLRGLRRPLPDAELLSGAQALVRVLFTIEKSFRRPTRKPITAKAVAEAVPGSRYHSRGFPR